MTDMKLNILLCDRFPGLLPEYIPSYASMFVRLFERNCDDFSYTITDVLDGELPSSDDDSDVYLVTGSNNGVYEDIPWIRNLLEWIRARASSCTCREQVGKGLIVGICFGHQAVAQALGGRVEKAPVGWGTGIRESKVTGEEGLRWFPSGVMRLMYNHHDQVVQLPEGAKVFASSDFCPVDGFTFGDNVITFQGHPEYVPEYAVHLIMDFADDEPMEVRTAALRSIGNMQHDGDTVARWITARVSG